MSDTLEEGRALCVNILSAAGNGMEMHTVLLVSAAFFMFNI